MVKGTQIKFLDVQDASGFSAASGLSSNYDDWRPAKGLSLQFKAEQTVRRVVAGLLTAE